MTSFMHFVVMENTEMAAQTLNRNCASLLSNIMFNSPFCGNLQKHATTHAILHLLCMNLWCWEWECIIHKHFMGFYEILWKVYGKNLKSASFYRVFTHEWAINLSTAGKNLSYYKPTIYACHECLRSEIGSTWMYLAVHAYK